MFYKLVLVVLRLLLPYRLFCAVKRRIDMTIKIMMSNDILKAFWTVIITPFKLVLSLIWTVILTFFIWALPYNVYGNVKYAVRMFYNDIIQSKIPIRVAAKRIKLFIEMVIKGREKKKKYGELNPDKTFYVIRPYYYLEANELCTTIANLLYHYYRTLHGIAYAQNKGWIPVVDWQNYGIMPHMENEPINGTSNGWEYYWNQPSGYSLEEAYQSKNVILSTRNSQSYEFMPSIAIYSPLTKYVTKLAELCPQYDKSITFNEITMNYINSWEKKLFTKNERILGVSVRGVAYGVKRIPGHPVQPTINELINFLNTKLEEWEIDKIYFTCEASWMVDEMKTTYEDKLIVLPRQRYDRVPSAEDNPLYEPGRRYQTNLDYLTEMYLLSKCTSLVAGMSSGVRNAVIWNDQKYEHIHIFEKEMWK